MKMTRLSTKQDSVPYEVLEDTENVNVGITLNDSTLNIILVPEEGKYLRIDFTPDETKRVKEMLDYLTETKKLAKARVV